MPGSIQQSKGKVFLVLLRQVWVEGALGYFRVSLALRWLVALRGKPLGPQVAVS
jgi:hypothetical protein